MVRLHRQPICVASALIVPLLTLANPAWLGVMGVGPAWSVLWLLPWALVDGPVSGGIAGVALGLVLDGLTLGDRSQVPALPLLGWWWGRLGRRAPPIQRSLNLGLLWIGSVGLGLSLILQLWIQVVERWTPDAWLGFADSLESGVDYSLACTDACVDSVVVLAAEVTGMSRVWTRRRSWPPQGHSR